MLLAVSPKARIQYPELWDPDWLQARLKEGFNLTEIANLVGCKRDTVRRARDRHGLRDVGTPGYGVPAELSDHKWLAARAAEGWSQPQLAEHLGCNIETVRKRTRRLGLKFRNPSNLPRFRPLWDREWLADRLNEGLHDRDIAQLLGCGRDAVARARRRYGLGSNQQTNRRDPRLQDREWLAARAAEGLSMAAVAELIPCNRCTVSLAARDLRVHFPTQVKYPLLHDEQWLREQCEAGLSAERIAERLGCSTEAVRNKIRPLGYAGASRSSTIRGQVGDEHIPVQPLQKIVLRRVNRGETSWSELGDRYQALLNLRNSPDAKTLKRAIGALADYETGVTRETMPTTVAKFWCDLCHIDYHELKDEQGLSLL